MIEKEDLETFEPGKRAIHLKAGSLKRLEDPIPFGKNWWIRFCTHQNKACQKSSPDRQDQPFFFLWSL